MWNSTLHFVILNSHQIQIIKQSPNILLAKISAYTVYVIRAIAKNSVFNA